MNYKILIPVGIIAVVVLALLLWFLSGKTSSSTPTSHNPPTFPVSPNNPQNSQTPTTQQGIVVNLNSTQAATFTTKDFIHNGVTAADTENPGSYVIAGSAGYCLQDGTCPTGENTKEYQITFNQNTDFFNIVLLQEPIGQSRLDAESYLERQLGLTDQQMCVLKYYVGVPYFVNEQFDDRNLGFSFCLGAVKLP